MICEPLQLVVPDGTGSIPVPSGGRLSWTFGTDVVIPVAVSGQNGAPYPLTGPVAALLAIYLNEGDPTPILQLEWTIVDGPNALAEFFFQRTMAVLLPPGDYYFGVQFRDDATGREDTARSGGTISIGFRPGSFDYPVMVPSSQLPLAQGQGFTFRGVYAIGTTYAPLDVVTYTQGGITSSYVCTLASTGNAPTDVTHWTLIASGASASGALPTPTGFPSGAVPVIRLVGGVPTWVYNTRLTQDDIDAGFGMSVGLTGTGTVEVGVTVAQVVAAASYTNGPPDSATFTDGAHTNNLASPFTASTLTNGGPGYTRSTLGSQSFTFSSTKSGVVKSSTGTITWAGLTYYGVQTPAAYTGAFVTGLPSTRLQSGFAGTYAMADGANTKRAYLVVPTGQTPSTFKNADTGFAVPMSKVATNVQVTNTHGATLGYDVYASDNLLAGAFNLAVS